ncbi:MAG: hypothetical protein AAGH89_11440 [Verrucomicrobiota bacterium]
MNTTPSQKKNTTVALICTAAAFALLSSEVSAMPPSKTTPALSQTKAAKTVKSSHSKKRFEESTTVRQTSARPRTVALTLAAKAPSKTAPYFKRKLSRP